MKPSFAAATKRRPPRFTPRGSVRGQTAIYLFSTIGMLLLLALWLFDSNTMIASSIRAQNAADASALAAAQWQARSLNAIGEINLIKAINNLLDNVPPGSVQEQVVGMDFTNAYATVQAALDSLQSRLSYEGPILAMLAAQQAAKNNGMPVNTNYTGTVRRHADLIRQTYQDHFSSGAWNDAEWAEKYAKMLDYIADEGVAVQNGNAKFYYANLSASGPALRYLLNKSFYWAIYGRDWCAVEDLLTGSNPYTDFSYWGPVITLPQATDGCEYYNLGVDLTPSATVAGSLTPQQITQMRAFFSAELDHRSLALTNAWPYFTPSIQWATYSPSVWHTNWVSSVLRVSMVAGPRTGYDFGGCDAVTCLSYPTSRGLGLSNRGTTWTSWLVGSENQRHYSESVARLESSTNLSAQAYAAARPFPSFTASASGGSGIWIPPGSFGSGGASSDMLINYQIILPVFDQVRLITRSLASWGEDDSDANWLTHKLEHTPPYTERGLDELKPDCVYCQALKIWEDPSFRQEGTDWLTETDPKTGELLHPCIHFCGGGRGGAGSVPFSH
jgi:hypothetical protein